MKLKKILVIALCATMLFTLSGCGGEKKKDSEKISKDGVEQVLVDKPKIEEMNKQANDFAKKIKEQEEEIAFYKDYLLETIEAFTPEQMQQVLDNEWTYSIKINNIDFPKNGLLELNQTDFTMYLSEKRVKHSIISPEMSEKARYKGNLKSSISIGTKIKPDVLENKVSEIDNTIEYKFTNLTAGDIINIRIPRALQEILKLDTTNLQIVIKK